MFGVCPRYLCQKIRVIPVGLSDLPGQARVQVYCPSCNDVYQLPPTYHRVDGAAFGTSFPHIFFKTFTHLVDASHLPPLQVYEPKIYGFKLYKRRRNRQRHERKPTQDDANQGSGHASGGTQGGESVSSSPGAGAPNHPQTGTADSSASRMTADTIHFGLGNVTYRQYTPNPDNMSWLRTKPNYIRASMA